MAGTFLDELTVEDVLALFPPNAAERIKANWPLLAASLKEQHLTSREMVLYTLGTIDAETWPKFSPAPERPSRFSKSIDRAGYAGIQDSATTREFGSYDSTIRFKNGKPIVNKGLGNAYYRGKDDALMRARHGDPAIPDLNEGEKFRGRGYVQITGRFNYERMQRTVGLALGIDLVEHPEFAERPDAAAAILACFLANHRQSIEKHMKAGHYKEARRVVNTHALHWEAIQRAVERFDHRRRRKAEGKSSPVAAPLLAPRILP